MNLIFLGDSLMQVNKEDTYPQTGWPQELSSYLKDDVKVLDFALNGRSTKSFINEGVFQKALDQAKPGDICFISFGHNDEKIEDSTRYTDPYTSYEKNLCYMANEMCSSGCKVILLSSICRLRYDENGVLRHTHGEYPKAMEDIANKTKRTYIDLEKITYDALSSNSLEENEKYYMILKKDEYKNYPDGKDDHTHLTVTGAKWVCSLLVPYLKEVKEMKNIFK